MKNLPKDNKRVNTKLSMWGVLTVVVTVMVEGTMGQRHGKLLRGSIKYRSTTKAVSQGRSSHKSPLDSPSSATHLFPLTQALPPATPYL